MRFVLGSENDAKRRALGTVAARFRDDPTVETTPVAAPYDQPVGVDQAREGARVRARRAREHDRERRRDAGESEVADGGEDADGTATVGVGVEGYVEWIDERAYLSVWSVLDDGTTTHEGGSGRSPLPPAIADRLPDEELGDVIEDAVGADLREGRGAVAVFTAGGTDRAEFTARSLLHAFGAFQRREE